MFRGSNRHGTRTAILVELVGERCCCCGNFSSCCSGAVWNLAPFKTFPSGASIEFAQRRGRGWSNSARRK